MTKKKTKKNQKGGQQSTPAADAAKVEKDMDMLEDIKRDEDLYISDIDVTSISNFIRTTNKSFNSLGNLLVEQFDNRCSLAILHTLLSLFDQDSEDREDVIRRLNIIYIVWRLPETEPEMKMKPQKNMNDVYNHPYSNFLFYVERMEKLKIESSLARIIVTNNVNVVEKLTAPDFMLKAGKLDVYKVDPEDFERWEEQNSAHWPEITEEMVSLSKAMRETGCFSERKDHEAGMAEAFYPLVHRPPTILPPSMKMLESEDPLMAAYCNEANEQPDSFIRRAQIVYSLNPQAAKIQEGLMESFKELKATVEDYQSTIYNGMTPNEKDEADREIALEGPVWLESSDSEVCTDEEDEDSDEERAEADFRAMTADRPFEMNDKTMEGCIERILTGQALTTSKADLMAKFAKTCETNNPHFLKLLTASETDDMILMMIRTNARFAGTFLSRTALSEQNTCLLFKRYIRLCQEVTPMIHALEIVMRLAKDFTIHNKMGPEQKAILLEYVRYMIRLCDQEEGATARNVRLIAMLIKKLLREELVTVDEIAADVKPFTLRYTESRECTALYKLITSLQTGEVQITQITEPAGGAAKMTTTTTTVNQGNTTTTTTVVSQVKHGKQTVKSTQHKVVMQASSLKALNDMRKSTNAMFRAIKSSSSASTSSESPTTSSSGAQGQVLVIREDSGDSGAQESKNPDVKPSESS